MIQTVKMSEQARQEYRFKSAVIMDAEDRGEARGSRQRALETARLMMQHNYPVSEISLMTGLTKEEIEKL